jgi:hypothetical protein
MRATRAAVSGCTTVQSARTGKRRRGGIRTDERSTDGTRLDWQESRQSFEAQVCSGVRLLIHCFLSSCLSAPSLPLPRFQPPSLRLSRRIFFPSLPSLPSAIMSGQTTEQTENVRDMFTLLGKQADIAVQNNVAHATATTNAWRDAVDVRFQKQARTPERAL